MRIISDASPLISLARIQQFDLLEKPFGRIFITLEVYGDVVVSGAGLPGAQAAGKAPWLEVHPIKNPASLPLAQRRFALDIGELSTLVLAKEIKADLLLLVEAKASPFVKAAFKGVDTGEIDYDRGGGQIEEGDAEKPEGDVGGPKAGGGSDPIQADNVQNLADDQVAHSEFLAELAPLDLSVLCFKNRRGASPYGAGRSTRLPGGSSVYTAAAVRRSGHN